MAVGGREEKRARVWHPSSLSSMVVFQKNKEAQDGLAISICLQCNLLLFFTIPPPSLFSHYVY